MYIITFVALFSNRYYTSFCNQFFFFFFRSVFTQNLVCHNTVAVVIQSLTFGKLYEEKKRYNHVSVINQNGLSMNKVPLWR